jgi:hypothetical protein
MPSTLAGFGLRAAEHPSGVIRPSQYSILSGYATGILGNQPVKIGANGTIEAAAVGNRFIGTFQGVTWTDANGVQQFSPQWTASTTGTNILAWVTRDPTIIYEIQADDTLTVANIGEQYDFNTASGSTVTGLSSMTLDVASTAANASLQVIGLNPGPDNAWGDAYPIVLVRISEHQFVADVAAF